MLLKTNKFKNCFFSNYLIYKMIYILKFFRKIYGKNEETQILEIIDLTLQFGRPKVAEM